MNNLLLTSDSYKASHWKQYPPGTARAHSYLEARAGSSVFFGLQYLIKRYLAGKVVTLSKVEEACEIIDEHMGTGIFNYNGWVRIFHEHNGRLPIEIRAIPEGTAVPAGTVMMTVENTDPSLPWLTSYIETLLVQLWYPCTIATRSAMTRKVIDAYLDETGTPELAPFKLHDFGFRGSTSVESAGIGGAAHLLSFRGTDTIAAVGLARVYYHEEMAGFSIPAAEHSTITSWGRVAERDAFANMLEQYPTGLVAVVSDSYDVYQACEIWGTEFHDRILARDGTLVIRPDSGDPVDAVLRVLHILGEYFPVTINSKGYKVLDPHVRVIQGDGIDHNMIVRLLGHLRDARWSADNLAFGSGGGLLQKVNRDMLGFAFKCSAIERDGEWRDVYKDPITDPTKRSRRGRQDNPFLRTVFKNGRLLVDDSFATIRGRML